MPLGKQGVFDAMMVNTLLDADHLQILLGEEAESEAALYLIFVPVLSYEAYLVAVTVHELAPVIQFALSRPHREACLEKISKPMFQVRELPFDEELIVSMSHLLTELIAFHLRFFVTPKVSFSQANHLFSLFLLHFHF